MHAYTHNKQGPQKENGIPQVGKKMALCACAAEHKLKPPYSGIALDRVLPAAADIWISGDPLLQKRLSSCCKRPGAGTTNARQQRMQQMQRYTVL
jgi:hypothetical protein